MSSTNDRTREPATKMADDTKMRSQLFTSHLKRFSGAAKAFKFVLV